MVKACFSVIKRLTLPRAERCDSALRLEKSTTRHVTYEKLTVYRFSDRLFMFTLNRSNFVSILIGMCRLIYCFIVKKKRTTTTKLNISNLFCSDDWISFRCTSQPRRSLLSCCSMKKIIIRHGCSALTCWRERDAGGRALHTALTVAGSHAYTVVGEGKQTSDRHPVSCCNRGEQRSRLSDRLFCFARVLSCKTPQQQRIIITDISSNGVPTYMQYSEQEMLQQTLLQL